MTVKHGVMLGMVGAGVCSLCVVTGSSATMAASYSEQLCKLVPSMCAKESETGGTQKKPADILEKNETTRGMSPPAKSAPAPATSAPPPPVTAPSTPPASTTPDKKP